MRNAYLIANIHRALGAARAAIAACLPDRTRDADARDALDSLLRLLEERPSIQTESKQAEAFEYLQFVTRCSAEALLIGLERFDTIRDLLAAATKESRVHLDAGNIQRAYACIDAVHALPTAIVSSRWDPRVYWNTYVTGYQSQSHSSLFEPFRSVFGVATPRHSTSGASLH